MPPSPSVTLIAGLAVFARIRLAIMLNLTLSKMRKRQKQNVVRSTGNTEPKNTVSTANPPDQNQSGSHQQNTKPMDSSGNVTQANSNQASACSTNNQKHWLDYGTFVVASFAFIAAFSAAGFTAWQAWIAKDTAKRQLRAYVSVKPVGQFNLIPNVILEQLMVIKNFGLSPAFNVREDSAIAVLPFPLTVNLNMGPPLHGTQTSKVTIFPTEEFPFTTISPDVLTEENIKEVLDGKRWRLYVIVKLTYDDIFRVNHFTHLCAMYGGDKPQITFCDRYNDTDDHTD